MGSIVPFVTGVTFRPWWALTPGGTLLAFRAGWTGGTLTRTGGGGGGWIGGSEFERHRARVVGRGWFRGQFVQVLIEERRNGILVCGRGCRCIGRSCRCLRCVFLTDKTETLCCRITDQSEFGSIRLWELCTRRDAHNRILLDKRCRIGRRRRGFNNGTWTPTGLHPWGLRLRKRRLTERIRSRRSVAGFA